MSTTPVSSGERRSFQRTRLSVLCKLWMSDDVEAIQDGASPLCGLTMDMSRDGFSAWFADPVVEGSRCLVHFFNADGRLQPEVGSAVIRRVVSYGNGYMVGIELDAPFEEINVPEDDWISFEPRTRVLAADGDEEMRGLLSSFLDSRGFKVETAATDEEALERMLAHAPDILLLDARIPEAGAQEVLRRMKEGEIEVGVIYTMSNFPNSDAARDCLRLGATDHIAKPFNLKYLDWSIRFALGAPR